MEAIIVALMEGLAAAAPGLLAAWTHHETDAEAIDTLKLALSKAPGDPVHTAVTDWKARMAAARAAKAAASALGTPSKL